jgi:hypothetical protein
VKKPEIKNNQNVKKDCRKVIQTKFEMKNVHNFSLAQTKEEKTKTETIVGQLTPSGNSYCIDKGGLISESFSL